MKKAIFAVLIVLLAMLAVTCDSAVLPVSGTPPPGQAGEPRMVTLNIDLGTSSRARALDPSQAFTNANFYEAVFIYNQGVTGEKIVRSSITKDTYDDLGWSITVPAVNYSAEKNIAVLFAGTNSGKVLLAIAEMTDDLTFADSTTVIPFTLNALKSGVADILADSTFKITAPLSHSSLEPIKTVPTYTTTPAFRIPSANGITATYAISLYDSEPYFKYAIVVDDSPIEPSVSVKNTGNTADSPVTATISSTLTDGDAIASGATVTLGFNINASAALLEQAAILYFSIPVNAVTKDSSTVGSVTPIDWVIQGGTANATVDNGSNGGGAVLLKVDAYTGPTVSVAKDDTSTGNWDGTSTLRYYIDEHGAGDIVLTATGSNFSVASNTVTYTWYISSDGTSYDGIAAIDTTDINSVDTSTNGTLTIPNGTSSNPDLVDGAEFYIYCTGTYATASETANSAIIKIEVFDTAQDTPSGVTIGGIS